MESGAGGRVTLVWFRRDLRVDDNHALIAASLSGPVVPVFVWSPEEEGQFYPGRASRWWLKKSLKHLAATLQALGAPLIVRRSRSTLAVLLEVIAATGATQLFYNHLYDPVSLVRDHRVKEALTERGILVRSFNGDLLHEPWEMAACIKQSKGGGMGLRGADAEEEEDEALTFETFFQHWLQRTPQAPLGPPSALAFPPVAPGAIPTQQVDSLGLESVDEKDSNSLLSRAWLPGCNNAQRALLSFFHGGPLLHYGPNRGKADSGSTSLLSPHLHFGELSVRRIYQDAMKIKEAWAGDSHSLGLNSTGAFLRTIALREYSRFLVFNFPFTHNRSLLCHLQFFPWRTDETLFKAWRQGRTGYPLVDAGMRELWATGWCHNRIRVVTASFCVKYLQLPWQWGMKYFWDALLDADLECDVLGWQYVSGSLPDGHEVDRMDDPEEWGIRIDPDGEYIRRWLPELSRLPTRWLYRPGEAPPGVLRAAGVELGYTYPRPVVDVGTARHRLQQAIETMSHKEAARKAGLANGIEEGGGESMPELGNIYGNSGVMVGVSALPRQEGRDPSRANQQEVSAASGIGAGGAGQWGPAGMLQGAESACIEVALRDQLVPIIPSKETVVAAEVILTTPGTDYALPYEAAAPANEEAQPQPAQGRQGSDGEYGIGGLGIEDRNGQGAHAAGVQNTFRLMDEGPAAAALAGNAQTSPAHMEVEADGAGLRHDPAVFPGVNMANRNLDLREPGPELELSLGGDNAPRASKSGPPTVVQRKHLEDSPLLELNLFPPTAPAQSRDAQRAVMFSLGVLPNKEATGTGQDLGCLHPLFAKAGVRAAKEPPPKSAAAGPPRAMPTMVLASAEMDPHAVAASNAGPSAAAPALASFGAGPGQGLGREDPHQGTTPAAPGLMFHEWVPGRGPSTAILSRQVSAPGGEGLIGGLAPAQPVEMGPAGLAGLGTPVRHAKRSFPQEFHEDGNVGIRPASPGLRWGNHGREGAAIPSQPPQGGLPPSSLRQGGAPAPLLEGDSFIRSYSSFPAKAL